MKRRCIVSLSIAWLTVSSSLLFAQGVYVIQGDKGPVFTDQPQAGAKELKMRPLSVVPAVKPPPTPKAPGKAPLSEPGDETSAPAYNNFSVISPANDGSLAINSGSFEVRLAIDPPLQLGEGHAFVVSLNGRQVGQRYTATEFMIPREFWGDEPPPPNQFMQLDASIVDKQGQVLKRATPVRFLGRYVTILNRPQPLMPHHPSHPLPIVHGKPQPSPPPPPVVHKPQSHSLANKPQSRPKPENEVVVMPPGKNRPSERKSSGEAR